MLGVEGKFEDAILSTVGRIIWSPCGFLRRTLKQDRKEVNGGKTPSVFYGSWAMCPVFCSDSPTSINSPANDFVEDDKELQLSGQVM